VLAIPGTATAAEQREVPDYDGRGDDPVTAGEVLIWVPRLALAPVWLVSEYVLRLPLGLLLTTLDKAGFSEWLADESDYLILPTVALEFGFRSSVGLYFGVNDLWFPDHQVRYRFAYGGTDFIRFRARDRVLFDDGNQRLGIFGLFRRRADDTFGGIGPDIDYDIKNATRFTTTIIEAGSTYDLGLGKPTELKLSASWRDVRHEQLPTRFGDGHRTFHPQVLFAADTREALTDATKFFRAVLHTSVDVSLDDQEDLMWTNYGLEVGAGLELFHRRVVSLSLATEFADPLKDDPVPLRGLVRLGGSNHLAGFGGDAFYGRSAAALKLKYHWPIWVYLDGIFHISMGNVYGPQLRDFDPEKLRMSFGPGISTSFLDENKLFSLSLGFGTDTFEQGTNIASVRAAAGISHGF
jgi:hypothetical protein